MTPSWIIWDWNGTLLDDTELCYTIANEMRIRRGLAALPDIDAYRSVMGFPIVDYYRRMGYTFENETYDDVSVEFVCMYIQRCDTCKLHEGAVAVLEKLAAMGIRQTLLSATGQDRLTEQVAQHGAILPFLTDVIGMPDNLAHGKAALADAFLKREGIDPAGVLFIGDTDHDYAVASSVGGRVLLLGNGHQTPDKLLATGAPVLADIRNVPLYIAGL